jgi:hypothetical protein
MEFMKAYQNLNRPNKEALDEAIMDMGITNYPALIKAVAIAETYMCEVSFRKTFKEFQAAKRAFTAAEAWGEYAGFEDESMEILEYPEGSFIIVERPGQFHLTIAYHEWRSNNLESLERILYDRWYC